MMNKEIQYIEYSSKKFYHAKRLFIRVSIYMCILKESNYFPYKSRIPIGSVDKVLNLCIK